MLDSCWIETGHDKPTARPIKPAHPPSAMTLLGEMGDTAKTLFAVETANGKVPEIVHGGEHDGAIWGIGDE